MSCRRSSCPFLRLVAVLLLTLPVAGHAQGVTLSRPGTVSDGAVADTLPAAGRPEPSRAERAFAERERARLERRGRAAPGREPRDAPPGTPGPIVPSGFGVQVLTDSPEYVVWPDPDETEPMQVQIVAESDGYLTLLSAGLGPDLTILTPNDLIAQFPVQAGVPVLFPLREWAWQGVELRPTLPEGVAQAPQSIIAVVTRRPVPLPLVDWTVPQGLPVDDRLSMRLFQAWLARIPVAERGVGQAYFLVTRGD